MVSVQALFPRKPGNVSPTWRKMRRDQKTKRRNDADQKGK